MTIQPIVPIWIILLLSIACLVGFAVVVIPKKYDKKFVKLWLRRLIVVIIIMIMAIRPCIPGQSRYTGNALLDVYFAIDNSVSMRAVDTGSEQSRLELAKADIRSIAEKIPGARYSVIGFSNDAIQELPLTNDATALASTAEILRTTERYVSSGTSIDKPLELLQNELKRNFDTTPDRGRILFYMGDGEQTVATEPRSFGELKQYLSSGYVLGYGSERGEKMLDDKWGDDDAEDRYIKSFGDDGPDRRDNFAITRLDQDNLNRIASQMRVGYFHRTAKDDIQAVVGNIDVGKIIRSSREVSTYFDLYWIFAILLVPLIIPDLSVYMSGIKSSRRLMKQGGGYGQ